MNKKEKIVCGICGIVLTAGSFIVGNIKGYNVGNTEGKATGIYQTIKNLDEMNMLSTSKGNAETAIQGTAIYRSLLKDSRFKGDRTDKKYANIKEDIKQNSNLPRIEQGYIYRMDITEYDSEVSVVKYKSPKERYEFIVYTDEFNKNCNRDEYIDSLVYEAREKEKKTLERIQKGGPSGAQEMKRAVKDFKAKHGVKIK